LIITCLLALALRFVEFAHQYSIVKDLKCFTKLQRSAKRQEEDQPQKGTKFTKESVSFVPFCG